MFIKNNFTLAMYTFSFGDGSLVKTSSTILECKNFKTQTHCAPSDRHSYTLKFMKTPIR